MSAEVGGSEDRFVGWRLGASRLVRDFYKVPFRVLIMEMFFWDFRNFLLKNRNIPHLFFCLLPQTTRSRPHTQSSSSRTSTEPTGLNPNFYRRFAVTLWLYKHARFINCTFWLRNFSFTLTVFTDLSTLMILLPPTSPSLLTNRSTLLVFNLVSLYFECLFVLFLF